MATLERTDAAIYAGADQTIRILIYSDRARGTRQDCSGNTVKVKVRDTSGGVTIYSTTAVTATSGNYTVTLDSSFHNPGKGTIYLLLDDKPYDLPKVQMFLDLP